MIDLAISLDTVGPGVFVIFDRNAKKAYISCSNNLLRGIAGTMTRIKEGDHLVCSHMTEMEIQIRYQGEEPRFHGTKIIAEFEEMGFEVLNKNPPVSLAAKVRILPLQNRNVAVVTLRSARGNERMVAAFENMEELSVWHEEHYPKGLVTNIVILDDKLLREVKEMYE